MGIVILCVAALAAFFILFRVIGKTPVVVKSNWQHFYSHHQFTPQTFYEKVEAELKALDLPGVKFGKESFLEKHILSAKREYLRISRDELVFYVGAAPFGKGSYVSWYLCEKVEQPLEKIPFLNKLMGKDRSYKTFYQIDTAAMYRSAVHDSVMLVLEGMTSTEGIRPLTERERAYTVTP